MGGDVAVIILIVGVLCILWAGGMWWWEWEYYKRHCIPGQTIRNFFRFIPYGKYLVIDFVLTALITGVLDFGMSGVGGVLGLFLSNIVSLMLMYSAKRTEQRHPQKHHRWKKQVA